MTKNTENLDEEHDIEADILDDRDDNTPLKPPPPSLSKGLAIYAIRFLQEVIELDMEDTEDICDELNELSGVVLSPQDWELACICLLEQLQDG